MKWVECSKWVWMTHDHRYTVELCNQGCIDYEENDETLWRNGLLFNMEVVGKSETDYRLKLLTLNRLGRISIVDL